MTNRKTGILHILLAGMLLAAGCSAEPSKPQTSADETPESEQEKEANSSKADQSQTNSADDSNQNSSKQSSSAKPENPSEQNNSSDPSEIITFTDDLGREISLTKPKRTAALIGSFADLWTDAGGKDSLVAAAHDAWTSFDLNLNENTADLGGVKQINLETLLQAQPDFVLASAKNDSQKQMLETLEQAGIPAAYFDVSSFEDYLRILQIFCQLTGDEKAYQENGISQQEQIEKTIKKAETAAKEHSPSVLYLRATGSSVKAKNSKGTVLGEMLEDLGTQNIADQEGALLDNLSLESIVEQDPEWIFVICQGSDDAKAQALLKEQLTSKPAWQNLRAVSNGKVILLDQRLYNLKPNARWAEAYENLYEILYEGKAADELPQ